MHPALRNARGHVVWEAPVCYLAFLPDGTDRQISLHFIAPLLDPEPPFDYLPLLDLPHNTLAVRLDPCSFRHLLTPKATRAYVYGEASLAPLWRLLKPPPAPSTSWVISLIRRTTRFLPTSRLVKNTHVLSLEPPHA